MFIPTDFQLSNGRHGLRSTNYRNTLFRQSRIPRKAKRAANEESKPGYLCWGRAGSLPSGEAVETVGFEVQGETHREISRETKPVRIENPDDPSQYVDVDQTNKMKIKKQEDEAKENTETKDGDFTEYEGGTIDKSQFQKVAAPKPGEYIVIYNPPKRAV